MSRVIKEHIKMLQNWVFQAESRVRRIAAGQGTPGTRAAPAQAGDNDKRIGLRLDNGEKIVKDGKEYRRYKVQANKAAYNATLREMANENSHRVWSYADVPIGAEVPSEAVEQMFEDLDENVKDE